MKPPPESPPLACRHLVLLLRAGERCCHTVIMMYYISALYLGAPKRPIPAICGGSGQGKHPAFTALSSQSRPLPWLPACLTSFHCLCHVEMRCAVWLFLYMWDAYISKTGKNGHTLVQSFCFNRRWLPYFIFFWLRKVPICVNCKQSGSYDKSWLNSGYYLLRQRVNWNPGL